MKNLFSTMVLLILFVGVKGQSYQLTTTEAKELLSGKCYKFDSGTKSGSSGSLIMRKIQFCSSGRLISNTTNYYYSRDYSNESYSTDYGTWNIILYENQLYLAMTWQGTGAEYIRLISNPYNNNFNFDWNGSLSYCGYTRCY